MRLIRLLLIVSLLAGQSLAAESVYLLTQSGLFQSTVATDGTPGWKLLANRSSVIVSGYDNPTPNPIPPTPDPIPQPKAESVTIAIVDDGLNRSAETAAVLNGLCVWNAFFDAGSGYRIYDVETKESRGIAARKELGETIPGIVITDKATRKVIHKGPVPATFEELKAIVGSLTGG